MQQNDVQYYFQNFYRELTDEKRRELQENQMKTDQAEQRDTNHLFFYSMDENKPNNTQSYRSGHKHHQAMSEPPYHMAQNDQSDQKRLDSKGQDDLHLQQAKQDQSKDEINMQALETSMAQVNAYEGYALQQPDSEARKNIIVDEILDLNDLVDLDDHDLNGTQEMPISSINQECYNSYHGGFMVNRSMTEDEIKNCGSQSNSNDFNKSSKKDKDPKIKPNKKTDLYFSQSRNIITKNQSMRNQGLEKSNSNTARDIGTGLKMS